MRIWTVMVALGALVMCVAPRAAAQDQGDQDPPSRVARLSYVTGSVSFQPAGADADDWGAAEQNRPITTGDKLWADQDGRAELRLGGSAMRLAPNTAFTFLNLTDTASQISVSEGELNVHLRRLDEGQSFEVDTPNLAFTALRPGDYTIIVDENGDTTWVTVRNGDGEITGGGQAFNLNSGQIGTFTGTDSLSGDVDQASGPDEFEGWAMQRNAAFDRPPAPYVSDQMVGYEDLQENGDWRDDPQYGHVWTPRVEAGWAPYQNGHWAWVAPWGWTWVDDAPWGFAPFHYGRWVSVRGAWCWTPGPVVVGVRPVYAPALVAWVGSPGVGIAIGGGGGVGVAWFPLGPREVYVPPYHVSERYVTNVNVTNTVVERTTVVNVYNTTVINKTMVNTTYINRSATVVTSRTAFTSAQPVRANVVRVDAATISRAPVGTYGGAGVAPVRASLVARGGGPSVRVPPAALVSRPIVAKTAPPRAPVPFAVQQKAIAANGGKPLATTKVAQLRPAAAPKAAEPVRVAPAAKVAPVTALKKPAAPLAKPPAPGAKAPAAAPANAARPGAPAGAAPGNAPAANKPGAAPAAPANANKPAAAPPANANKPPAGNAPANKPPAAAGPPANANRPPANAPAANKPAAAPPAANKPAAAPPANAPANRPPAAAAPPANANRPPANAPAANKPAPAPPANANKPPAAAASPANRPPNRPTETPANKPPARTAPAPAANKPPAKPAEKPAEPVTKPAARPAPAENRPPAAAKPADKPAAKPNPNRPETPQEKAAREKREKENKPQ